MVGGTYTGQVKVTATVRDLVLTKTLPVTFNLEANRIVLGAGGVGLLSSPARSVLSRAVGCSAPSAAPTSPGPRPRIRRG